MSENMHEYRCPDCNKLLFRYDLKGYLELEIKCSRCDKVINDNVVKDNK